MIEKNDPSHPDQRLLTAELTDELPAPDSSAF
jgi:hypothetical protein